MHCHVVIWGSRTKDHYNEQLTNKPNGSMQAFHQPLTHIYSVRLVHFSRANHSFSKCSGWKLHSVRLKGCKREWSWFLMNNSGFLTQKSQVSQPLLTKKEGSYQNLKCLTGLPKQFWQRFKNICWMFWHRGLHNVRPKGAALCRTLSCDWTHWL